MGFLTDISSGKIDFKMILIVDDEEDVCYLVQRLLKARGYATHCSFDLKSSRNFLTHREVNVIILDINLGSENGLDLLEEKAIDSQTKIIVMSAHGDMAQEAYDKGADLFLPKPFSPSALLEAVSVD